MCVSIDSLWEPGPCFTNGSFEREKEREPMGERITLWILAFAARKKTALLAAAALSTTSLGEVAKGGRPHLMPLFLPLLMVKVEWG